MNEMNKSKIRIKDISEMYDRHKPLAIGQHRYFSVLIPFIEMRERLYILFEERSAGMKSQPGEICFPGGQMEIGENAEKAAIRETEEEIGIKSERISIVGRGDTLFGYANYTLETTIARIDLDALYEIELNKNEVEQVLLLPFDEFVSNSPEMYKHRIIPEIKDFPYEAVDIKEDYEWRIGDWEIPIYRINGRIIWGLTARIMKQIVDDFTKIK